MRRRTLVFLDIDGVMNDHPCSEIMPAPVMWLNYLLQRIHEVEIVFNTAWNSYTLPYMRQVFVAAGFKHPTILIGQTDSCSGGGDPVRGWLTVNSRVGDPYIIIDDSTHGYDEMWGRLIRTNPDKGFTQADAKRAIDLTWRGINTEQRERIAAVENLSLEAQRLAFKTPWMTDDERRKYVERAMELSAHCLVVPNFLEAAFLKDPE